MRFKHDNCQLLAQEEKERERETTATVEERNSEKTSVR